ncbi:MAG: hypothetical protein HW380_1447 [Magnetococcales bacterium]|nr:hypothetical protein [Magnetococcales bacterium]
MDRFLHVSIGPIENPQCICLKSTVVTASDVVTIRRMIFKGDVVAYRRTGLADTSHAAIAKNGRWILPFPASIGKPILGHFPRGDQPQPSFHGSPVSWCTQPFFWGTKDRKKLENGNSCHDCLCFSFF